MPGSEEDSDPATLTDNDPTNPIRDSGASGSPLETYMLMAVTE
jgi:hypothetical protein